MSDKNIWVAAADGDIHRVQVGGPHQRPRPPLTFSPGPRRASLHVPFHLICMPNLKQTLAISPNAPDAFTYTPMHAAASYAQLDVLAYLVQQGNHPGSARGMTCSTLLPGGDVNITDEDGDTPLYTVENIATAQWLIDHGAVIDRRNGQGVSASLSSHRSHISLIVPSSPSNTSRTIFPRSPPFCSPI